MSNQFGAKAMLRSALLMTGSTYVAFAASLVTSMLIARGLGPTDYGRYAYLVWLCSILIVLMNHGLNVSSIRFISEALGRSDRPGSQALYAWFQKRHVQSMLLVTVVFLVCLPVVRPEGMEERLLFFAFVAVLASASKAAYLFNVSVAKGYGLFSIEASTISMLSIANLIGAAVLRFGGGSLDAYILLFLAISIVHPFLAHHMLKKADIRTSAQACDEPTLKRVRSHLSWAVVSTLVATFSNKSFETFLLHKLTGAEAVGFFTIAATLARGGVDLLATGLSTVLMPLMANAYGAGGQERLNRIARDSIRYYHFLGLLLTGIGLFWAQPMITIFYGESYAPTAFALQMMVIIRGFTLSSAAFGALLSITDNQRLRAGESFFAVITSAAAAMWLVPKYGLTGAVLAHMLSTIAVFMYVFISVNVVLKMPLPYSDVIRITTSSLCAIAICLGLLSVGGNHNSPLHLILAGILYIPLYLAGTLVFKAWNQYDLGILGNLGNRIPAFKRLAFLLAPWARNVPK